MRIRNTGTVDVYEKSTVRMRTSCTYVLLGHAYFLGMRTFCAYVLLAHAYFLGMRTSCTCILLAHTYFLRMRTSYACVLLRIRTACSGQRTDALSAASLLRCACSARKSSSGRTACSRVRMRLLCSHTGHRQPIPGLQTLATFTRDRGNEQVFIPQLPDPWIGPVLRIRIRNEFEKKLFY
jgi:hypothetical protein